MYAFQVTQGLARVPLCCLAFGNSFLEKGGDFVVLLDERIVLTTNFVKFWLGPFHLL